jgi:hypothetical protein
LLQYSALHLENKCNDNRLRVEILTTNNLAEAPSAKITVHFIEFFPPASMASSRASIFLQFFQAILEILSTPTAIQK